MKTKKEVSRWLSTGAEKKETAAARRLSNEIYVYTALWQFLDRHPDIVSQFPDVRIPKLIEAHEHKNERLILMEYIEGERLEDQSWEMRKKSYERVLAYLKTISLGVAQEEGGKLPRRSHRFLLAILPIIILKAIVRHPAKMGLIMRGFFQACLSWPALGRTDRKAFAHRDPGGWNILVRDQRLWVIDFDLSAITHPLTDLVALSLKLWDNREEGREFSESSWVRTQLVSHTAQRAYRALSLHLALYNLALPNGRHEAGVSAFIRYLLADSVSIDRRPDWKQMDKSIVGGYHRKS